MYIGIPQIIYLFITILGLGIVMAKHGQERKGKHDFWTSLISNIISIVILYYGGFFTK